MIEKGPAAILLAGDRRRIETFAWQPWLDEAAVLAARFCNELYGDDPFAYNETASVSLLSAAAARIGYLGLAEFATTKKAAADRRRRAHGRSDFWMMNDARSWAFEFKQLWQPITIGRLKARLADARADAVRIAECDADVAVAGLIVPLRYVDVGDRCAAATALDAYAEYTDFAWRLDVHSEAADTYLFFTVDR